MDFTALVEAFLRRVEGRRLERLAAELWKFAEALDDWLHDLFAHPSTEWRDQLEAFLAWQEAEGRRAMPESKRSLLDYLTWWSTSIGLEPASPQRAPVAVTSESSGETSAATSDEKTQAEQPAGGYPEAFGPAAGMLEEDIRSRSALAMPPLVGEAPPVPDRTPRIVKIEEIQGFWDDYRDLLASGQYEQGWWESISYSFASVVLPSSERSIKITFDDGTVLILLGGGPDSGALAGQATVILGAHGAVVGSGTLWQAVVAALKHLGRETAETVADNVVQEVTGLPVGPTGLLPKKGKSPKASGSSPPPKPRQISNLRRRSAKELNEAQIRKGRFPPYHARISVRDFVTQQELRFARLYADPDFQNGRWMVRSDAIAGMTPEEIESALGLENIPRYITDVTVPAGHRMRLSIVGAQPQWGMPARGIEQYESLQTLPDAAFTNRR